jgi:hypothetical protein
MLKQTLIWTTLPNGGDTPVAEGSTLRLSVVVSPRLWNDDPAAGTMKLSSFPDFLDWPSRVAAAGFRIEFADGSTLDAVPDPTKLRSDLWRALFKENTDVIPYVFEDLSDAEILTFPSATIHDTIRSVYQRAATEPGYGAGRDLPHNTVLVQDPDLRDIAEPVRPEPPYEPENPDRGPVVLDEPEREPDGPPAEPGRGCGCLGPGCLGGCLLAGPRLIGWLLRRIFRLAGPVLLFPLAALTGLAASSRHFHPNGGGGGGAPVNPKRQAFTDLKRFVEPTSKDTEPLPEPTEMAATYDFHGMVAALGDYPKLMRSMGLVVDLVVTLPADMPAATGTVRVQVDLPLVTTTTHHTPRTHYELDDAGFLARPRPTNPEIRRGLLRLDDNSRFRVQHVDVAGSGVKLQNTATNLIGLHEINDVPVNAPDESGLPALQTAGISIVRPNEKPRLRLRFLRSHALNRALAVRDLSPLPPPASGEPAPAAADELYAEDVVRGYRIDVWDDRSNRWHSLSRRIGRYRFLEPADGDPTIEVAEEDEGFVQMSTTEPVRGSTPRVLRAHESLFTWDGWSLAAPRPGKTILAPPPLDEAPPPDNSVGEVPNPAVTPFKLETEFRARPGSLPRLRFGYRYRLRARVADLAGNSVFEPGSPEFDASQAEVTEEMRFRRFEPVGPPPVMLRAAPKEGESLERLTVRSAVDDPAATITAQATERHLAPPKTAQLMAERHHKFDGSAEMRQDAAAYDLASREAGSLTQRMNSVTGELEPVPGVVEDKDPDGKHTYWLQTGDSFDVAYLPDPFARGVLLVGLPGMATPDEITDGVNRIAFQGDWPDLRPLRLRLAGLPRGAPPAEPDWDKDERVLTVQLPQGETATVRISSYFHAEDLQDMAIWGWTEAAAPPQLDELRATTLDGRNWLHLPFRTLELVHAVQQPLEIPEIAAIAVDPARKLGETTISLSGTLAVDAKSTGKVDLHAEWTDPTDDLTKAAPDETHQEMLVEELTLPDAADDTPTFASILAAMGDPHDAVRHALGDTKYHRITYTATGSTRFREHFPPDTPAKELIRPLPGETVPPKDPTDPGGPKLNQAVLEVRNAARPDAPRPLYVLPTFGWSENEAGGVRTRERRGGGLRIYLERPWYSSGAGELLGVLVRPAPVPLDGPGAAALRKYTSEWGMDPLWQAAETAPLRLEDLLDPAVPAGPVLGSNLLLDELPTPRVDAAGFRPVYDKDRRLWAVDVEMRVEQTYFPFVRLALARFHPHSVAGADLSRVVLSDFVQVAPHRTVEYHLANVVANGEITVRLRGGSYVQAHFRASGTSVVLARLERRQHGDTQVDNEVGWEAIQTVALEVTSRDGFEMQWEGTLSLPDPLPQPLRVSVLEAEIHRSDGRPTGDLLNLLRQAQGGEQFTSVVNQDLGYRIVFADAAVVA